MSEVPGDAPPESDFWEPTSAPPPRAAPSGNIWLPDEPGSAPRFPDRPFVEPAPVRPPGPGIPECIGWMFLILGSQLVSQAATLVGIFAWHAAQTGERVDLNSVASIVQSYQLVFIGGSQAGFVLCAILAAGLRLLPRPISRLNCAPPAPGHFAGTIALTLPLAVICTTFYNLLNIPWKKLVEQYPELLSRFEDLSSMELIQDLAKDATLTQLVLILAVTPAIAEELFFRGIIGRGLVARWGVTAGVVMTSCLFGLVHMHPVHALAVIPLGAAMHVLYLQTRSFWIPMLLHFCNNAWAAFEAKHASSLPLEEVLEDPVFVGVFVVLACCAAGAVFWLFQQTRIQYLLPDGRPWSPGYTTCEEPPDALGAVRRRGPASPAAIVAALLSLAAFYAVLGFAIRQALS